MQRATIPSPMSSTFRDHPGYFLARRHNCVISHALNRTIGVARRRLASLVSGILFFATLPAVALGTATLPAEIRSDRFAVTVNGVAVPVAQAVAGYHFADFDLAGAAEIAEPGR
jgi:hypothetical protein